MKRILSLLLALAICLSSFPAIPLTASAEELPAETTAPAESAEPVETTAPAETTEPVETTAATESSEPVETTVPLETTEPAETTAPVETTAPAETTEPTAPEETRTGTAGVSVEAHEAAAAADVTSGTWGENVTWEFNTATGMLTVSGNGSIPHCVYASEHPWYPLRDQITDVVLEEGITSLGGRAFSGYTKLKSVSLPSTLESILYEAFYGCTSLTEIDIPDSVTTINEFAFYGCSSLKKVTLPANLTHISKCLFSGCAALEEIVLPAGITIIEAYAFNDCTSLKSIYLPQYVTYITAPYAEESPFYGCSSDLMIYCSASSAGSNWGRYWNYCDDTTALSVVYGVSAQDYASFWSTLDKHTERIEIPETVTSLPDDAFTGFPELSFVYIPASVTTISATPFTGCDSFIDIYCEVASRPDGWNSKWNYHYDNGILSVRYGYTLYDIEFWDSFEATGSVIEIPEGVTIIPNRVFSGNTGITQVILPDTLRKIGDEVFYGCTALQSVNLPDGLTYIGRYAFYDCTALQSVNLPDGLTYIGGHAFRNCKKLAQIRIPDSVTTLGSDAFAGCKALKEVTVPGSVKELAYTFDCCEGLETVILLDGITDIYDGTFSGCISLKSVALPDSLKTIGEGAFQHCGSLESIELPGGLTEIRYAAFMDCTGLKTVYIPESVTTVGSCAFLWCNPDLKISCGADTAPEGWDSNWNKVDYETEDVYSVEFGVKPTGGTCGDSLEWEFNSATGTLTISGTGDMAGYTSAEAAPWHAYRSEIKKVVLPDGLTQIADYAFDSTAVTEIDIPDSVTWLGAYAFYNCQELTRVKLSENLDGIWGYVFYGCKKLTDVVLPESIEEILTGAFQGCESLTSITFPAGITKIISAAFCNCTGLKSIYFTGNAPWVYYAFNGVTATVYYPGNDATWTKTAMADFGGELTFEPTYPDANVTLKSGAGYLVEAAEGASSPVEYNGSFSFTVTVESGYYKSDAFKVLVNGVELTDPDGDSIYTIENITEDKTVTVEGVLVNRDHSVKIGGKAVTDENLSGTGWRYDPDANVLYLSDGFDASITVTRDDLTVEVSGTASASYIDATVNKLTLKGSSKSDRLHVTYYGLEVYGSTLQVDNLTLDVIYNGDTAIFVGAKSGNTRTASGSFIINDAHVSARSKVVKSAMYGIWTGSLIVNGSSYVYGSSGQPAVPGIYISGSGSSFSSECHVVASANSGNAFRATGVTLPEYAYFYNGGIDGYTSLNYTKAATADVFVNGSYTSNNSFEYLGLDHASYHQNTDGETHSLVCACSTYPKGKAIACSGGEATCSAKAVCDICGSEYGELNPDVHTDVENGTCTDCGLGGTCGENLTWRFDKSTGTLTVAGTGYMNSYAGAESVPWHNYRSSIKKIIVEDGIRSIGDYAFYDCTVLELVEFQSLDNGISNLESIGTYSFFNCESLKELNIPDSVLYIGERAFCACYSLVSIELPKNMQTLDDYVFAGCSNLQSIIIPESVTYIGTGAFDDCKSLSNIAIPSAVASIGEDAFIGCTNINKVDISSLERWCSIDFATPYSNPLFYASNLYLNEKEIIDLVIPDAVTEIKDFAFYNCTSIQSVTISPNLKHIGTAFDECRNICKVYITDLSHWFSIDFDYMYSNPLYNGATLYLNNSEIKSLIVPEDVEFIKQWALSGCVFENVILHSGITHINAWAFRESNVDSVIFLGDAPSINLDSFWECTTTAVFPATNPTWTSNVLQNYGGTINWVGRPVSGVCGESLTWSFAGGTLTVSGTGAMADYSLTDPAPWAAWSDYITNLVIEEGVTSIGDYAFRTCEAIKTGSLPESLVSVGETAFREGVSAIRFTVAQTVRQWSQVQVGAGNEYFPGWDNTTFVNNAPIVKSGKAGEQVYWELNQDGELEFFGIGEMYGFGAIGSPFAELAVKRAVITEGITNIGMNLFEAWESAALAKNLESVTVASTVKRVETMAFTSCKALKTVHFTGDAPSFGENCFRDVTATVYYPAGNDTWTADIMEDYEGHITWKAFTPPIASGTWGDNLTWVLEKDGTLTISGVGYMYADGSDMPWKKYSADIKTLILEEGITTVAGHAFSACHNLESVTLPGTLETIHTRAFAYCSALEEITIPRSVNDLGNCAFYDCTSLTDITFEHGVNDSLDGYLNAFNLESAVDVKTVVRVPYTNNINYTVSSIYFGNRTVTYKGTVPVPATGLTMTCDVSQIEAGLLLPLVVTMEPAHTTSEPIWTVTGNAQLQEDGTVVGTAPGEVTVRCASSDDETLYAEVSVTVLPPTANVSGITVRAEGEFPDEVEVGTSVQMIADVQPGNAANKAVTWSLESGTGTAALDSSGVLTALTPGTVTVTATATDGTEIIGTRVINIVRYAEDLTILLNGNAGVTRIGVDETMLLSAIVSPEDATSKDVTWKLENVSGEAKLITYAYQPPEIRGVSEGKVILTAVSADSRKASTSVTLTVAGEVAAYEVTGGNIYYNTVTGAIVGSDKTVTSANIPAKMPDGTVITSIASYAFAWKNYYYQDQFNVEKNTVLTSVTVPSTVTDIGDRAFYNCTALSSVKIGSGVKAIGSEAFRNTALVSLTIPDSVKSIGKDAFYGLSSLKHLTMSGEWDARNWLSCQNYEHLETVTFTGSRIISQPHREYEDHTDVELFHSRNVKKVIITDSVTDIEKYAFYACNDITSVVMGSNVQSIGNNAFHYCSSLTEVQLPETVTSIGEGAFEGCRNLTELNLPDSLTYIGRNAFGGCEKLQLLDLSNIPAVIVAKEYSLANKAGVPAVLVSATGGKTNLQWVTRMEDPYQDAWGIAGVFSRDNGKTWILQTQSTGEVILECRDEYTGAMGWKKISIETGIELRGMPEYLVSGKNVTMTAYRMPENIQENVSWSIREEDKDYASLSTGYGKSVRLTAKNVDRAVQVQVTAVDNMDELTVMNVWILPKATGVTIFESGSEMPVGQTGMTVQTLNPDMHDSNIMALRAAMQPAGALEKVTWKSSSTAIATVDENGIVTMKRPGTVTITATSTDGTNKSASVKLAVTYLDPAASLTASAEVPAIGLQEKFSTTVKVFGTDKQTPLDPAELIFTSSDEKMATVNEKGVITAGAKTGTVTVTAAIAGDPLNRRTTVRVKIIAAQTEELVLTPKAEEPAEIVMLDIHGDMTEDPEKAVKYAVYLDKDDVKSGTYSFDIQPSALNTNGETMTLSKTSLRWTTTDARVATVRQNADSTVTVTVKAKIDGACAINAVTTDFVKLESDLTVYVRDYAPRLETANLTLNPNRISGVVTGLIPSYGNEIQSVSLHEYDSKTRTYLKEPASRLVAAYADGKLTVTHTEFIKNSTVKLLLKAVCANGETYEYQLSLRIVGTLPVITVKQPVRFNLHTGALAELTVTAKDTAVTDVILDQADTDSFILDGFDAASGTVSLDLTEAYCAGGKLDAKVDLLIYLEDYSEPVRKTVTVSTVTTNPAITIKQLTKFNLFYRDSAALFEITAKNLTVTDVVLKQESTATFRQLSFDKESGTMAVGYLDETARLDASAELLIYLEGYNVPIIKTVSIGTVNTKPVLSLSAASSIINTALNYDPIATFRVWNKTAEAYMTADTITVDAAFAEAAVEGDTVTLTLIEEEGKVNRGGTANVTVQADNWLQPIKLTHRVTVDTKLPVASVSNATLKLNRIFFLQEAQTEVKLNQGNMGISSIRFESTAREGTAAWVEAQKIGLAYADGIITASIPDGQNVPKNGTYDFRYYVTLTEGTELAVRTFRVNVHSTVPTVRLKTTLLRLNTVLQWYGETAETTATLFNGTGYKLIDFQLSEDLNENIAIFFDPDAQTLSATLLSDEIALKNYAVKMYPVVYHEETEQTAVLPAAVTVNIQAYKTLPNPALKTGSLKLNRIFTEQTAQTAVSLNLAMAEIGYIDFVPAAKEGTAAWTEANKIRLEYDSEGFITASFKDGSNAPKNGNYDFRYTVTLTSGTELAAKSVRVNVHSTVPAVRLKTGTLKLNKFLGDFAAADTSVSLSGEAGYVLADLLLPEDWNDDIFGLSYLEKTKDLSVWLKDPEAANKIHTVYLTPVIRHEGTQQEVTLDSKVRLNVQVYSAKPGVSVSAKGKLDTTDPNSALIYTVNSLSNVTGVIEGVDLEGEDAQLFRTVLDNSGTKPTVSLTMKNGAEYATNKTYKLQMIFSVCGQDIPVNISFRISQSALRFGTVPTVNLYQFQTQPMYAMVTLNTPAGAKLETVTLSSKTDAAFRRAMAGGEMTVTVAEDGRTALVGLLVKNPGYLVYGRNYNVYLDITPENNATNIAPTQLRLTVKTVK